MTCRRQCAHPKPAPTANYPHRRGSNHAIIHVMFLTSPATSARTNAQLHTGPNPWLSHPTRFLKRSSLSCCHTSPQPPGTSTKPGPRSSTPWPAYETRTRAEMLQAAHIIAFGMTTLDVLAEAKTAEMSQSMRLRYRRLRQQPQSLHPADRKGARPASRRPTSSRPRRNAGAHGRHAAGRDNGRHSAIQSEDRHPAPPRQPRHRPAPRARPDVGPRTLGHRDAERVAAAGRSGPTLPIVQA